MFSTGQTQAFIIADTPGHEQYTRNMATGASNADLAVVLTDARKGVLPQTCRHTTILALLGIRHVIVAVNKMDLVDWSREAYDGIVAAYRDFAKRLDVTDVTGIPVSALTGDNVTEPSAAMDWYDGPTLLQALERADVSADRAGAPFRLPVQWVNRPNAEFRGFAGTIASGLVRPGDAVVVSPSNKTSAVERIVGPDGDLDRAGAGQAVTLTLADEVDVSRGDIIASAAEPPSLSDQFACHIVWMHENPLLPERPYLLRIGTRLAGPRSPPSSTSSTSPTWSTPRPGPSGSTTSPTATSASTAGSPSTPTGSSGRRAASSSSTVTPTRRWAPA